MQILIFIFFLLFLKYKFFGLIIDSELKITDGYIKRKEKKNYDCIRLAYGDLINQKFSRIYFCIGFGYNLGKLINLIFIIKLLIMILMIIYAYILILYN